MEFAMTRHGDPSVVDDARKSPLADGLLDDAPGSSDRPFLRDVENYGRQRRGRPLLQRLAVLRAAYAGEDLEPLTREVDCRRGADPGRRSRNDDVPTVGG